MSDPWAFVAIKNGKWRGVIAADSPKKDLRKFYADFFSYEIKTAFSREEYLAIIGVKE